MREMGAKVTLDICAGAGEYLTIKRLGTRP